MASPVYEKERTALLFIDPYNDFLSEGGKLWARVEAVAKKVGLLENLRTHHLGDAPERVSPFHRAASALAARRLRGLELSDAVPAGLSQEAGVRRRLLGR
jgi:nicotinamidase-related amidase